VVVQSNRCYLSLEVNLHQEVLISGIVHCKDEIYQYGVQLHCARWHVRICRYEKKRGQESKWYAFIKELDRQRARGPLAAESPILWTADEVETYLKGSSAVTAWKERMESLREEYESLDTVWFMSGSLFNKYPYDVPTEAFSFEIFKQAFAAVQASVVHLQA
jgi:hypothetical protein